MLLCFIVILIELCAFVDLLNTACTGILLNNEDGEDAESSYISIKIVLPLLMFGNKNEMWDRTGISEVLPNLRNVFICTTSVTLVCCSQLYG
jgi:hypothetical protein